MITKQNSFSRSISNEAKAGAYYTDLQHCRWIGNFLKFPEDEVCAMDPSIGNGAAIKETTGNNQNIKIFGVEINPKTYEEIRENPSFHKILNEDFLSGVKISPKSFSYVFANPPYGTTSTGDRLELKFLPRISGSMCTNGILVYVIPEHLLSDIQFLQTWAARFTTAHLFRFHEKEYKKFHQVVLFGVRKNRNGYYKQELEQLQERITEIETLPEDYSGDRLSVPASSSSNISSFCCNEENPLKNILFLKESPIPGKLSEKWSTTPYTATQVNQPVVELNTNLKYLVAVSGGGQGMAGDDRTGDLHLQRGTVKRVSNTRVEEKNPGSEILKTVVTETSSVVMTLIENDGKITRFE